MSHALQFYIGGAWVDPVVPNRLDVIDPSNEDAFAEISLGSEADVDRAVAAAKRAFETFGFTRPAERLALLRRIIAVYKERRTDLAVAVSREMGATRKFALENQVGVGLAHLEKMAKVLETFAFEENYPAWDAGMPFGGYKQSGNGREYAEYGLEELSRDKGYPWLRGGLMALLAPTRSWHGRVST